MAVTFSYLPLPSGKRIGVIGAGGGATVLAADDCTNAGLFMPHLPIAIQDELKSYLGKGGLGVGLSNPVDISDQGWNTFCDCVKAVLDYNGIDLLIAHLPTNICTSSQIPGLVAIARDVVKAHEESRKPMAVVIEPVTFPEAWHAVLDCERECCESNLPVYHSWRNAAKSITRFLDYHERKKRIFEQEERLPIGKNDRKVR